MEARGGREATAAAARTAEVEETAVLAGAPETDTPVASVGTGGRAVSAVPPHLRERLAAADSAVGADRAAKHWIATPESSVILLRAFLASQGPRAG